MRMRILLVEDDQIIADGLMALLRTDGYVVDHESTIAKSLERIEIESYDCLILDRGLPDGDGTQIVDKVRKESIGVPILMLTAKYQPHDVIDGLDAGADDYLSKPFLPQVLLARVRSLVRRKDRPVTQSVICVGDICVNTNSHTVTRRGELMDLSPKEYQLFAYLIDHIGVAMDRQTILEHVWGEDIDMFSNTVDVHVRYIREKLDKAGVKSIITTVRGKGYMICTT